MKSKVLRLSSGPFFLMCAISLLRLTASDVHVCTTQSHTSGLFAFSPTQGEDPSFAVRTYFV